MYYFRKKKRNLTEEPRLAFKWNILEGQVELDHTINTYGVNESWWNAKAVQRAV